MNRRLFNSTAIIWLQQGILWALSGTTLVCAQVQNPAATERGELRPRGTYTAELIEAFLEEERHRTPKARTDSPMGEFEKVLLRQRDVPPCTKPNVRLEEVHDFTPGSEKLDVMFYEKKNSEQQARANAWTSTKVAYDPLLFTRKDTGKPDFWQFFAHRLELECLPTRFRFVNIGSKRYMEFREGEKAWTK